MLGADIGKTHNKFLHKLIKFDFVCLDIRIWRCYNIFVDKNVNFA